MPLLWDAHWISTHGVAGFSHAGDNRLQHKRHVRARTGVHGGGLLFPDSIDVFVELSIHIRADTTVIVTEFRLAKD
jgi:hypothetical protein